jgi:ribonuclease P protein subunit RPR2
MKHAKENIAKERILILFEQAESAAKAGDQKLAQRYVRLAKAIGMKAQLPIPRMLKRRFCKKCYSFFISSKTVRVRVQKKDKRVTYTCLVCGNVQRYPFVREKKAL